MILPPPERKAEYVREMFTSIAPRYDLINRLMTLGLDTQWRRWAVLRAGVRHGDRALDVATGTGDLALELARRVGPTGAVVGVDFSEGMLGLAEGKARAAGLANIAHFRWADALDLPFEDGEFDAATVGFAGRNVTDLYRFFSEMRRVVRPGGRVVHLEISRPTAPILSALFKVYFYHVIPVVEGRLAGARAAYTYLPSSLTLFPSPPELARIMGEAGLKDVRYYPLTFGTVTIHVGVAP
jgi:demethylmenaquinone methyltransferase/2-methoxy-6-polyprenyl-1,4-benzoquinol methylase